MTRRAPFQRFARFGWVCALSIGFTLAARAATLEETPVDRPFVKVKVLGSLPQVNAGAVSPWDLLPLDTSHSIAALGHGTLGRYNATGEMLSFAGRTFIRAINPKTGAVQVVETRDPYQSPFAIVLGPLAGNSLEMVFPRTYRFTETEPQLLHTVLERLAVEVNGPIGVIGWAEMPEVEGAALKRAPVENEPLTSSNKDQYLEAMRARDAHVVFFAVVSPVLALPPVTNTLLTAKAFDYTPEQGQPAAALVHIHAALVNEPTPMPCTTTPLLLEGLRAVTVNDICHLYGTSTVQRGVFMVFQLDPRKH